MIKKNKAEIKSLIIVLGIFFMIFPFSNLSARKAFNREINTSVSVSELWSYQTGLVVISSPALGDVDEDGKLEVVVGSHDGNLYTLNGEDGSLVWSFGAGSFIYSSPALGDVDGDGKLEVVVGSGVGIIYTLNGEDGSVVWSYETKTSLYSTPALGDVDGDGKLEVVIGGGSSDDKIYVLNGEDGSIVWTYPMVIPLDSSPALGDIDGDGKLEVVIGDYYGRIYALNGEDGSIAWTHRTGYSLSSSPALGDVDGDGKLEVVVGSGQDLELLALNGEDGSVEWRCYRAEEFDTCPALGDLDGDGKLEVVVGSMGGSISSLNGEDGSIAWSSYHAIGRSSPALGDVDGDGKLEVIFGTYNYKNDNYIYALNGEDGNEAWSYRIGAPRDIVRSSPALGDLDGDGMLEVVVGCDNTYVHALKPTPSGEEIKWQGLAGEDFLRKRALTATAGKDPDYIITQITNNDYRDSFPQIYNGLITWEGNDGYDNEIFLYDSSTGITTQITNDNDDNWGPQIDDGLVTWVGYDGPDWEIFLHDSGTDITTQITKNNEDDWSPQIHAGQLTWIGFDGDMEIFFYDGESNIQISHNSYIDSSPQIHDGQITWYEYDWHDEEIYFYDGKSTIQITDNDYGDCVSQIYDGLIIWYGWDGHDGEIFLYDSNTEITTQITNNDYHDSFPQIHNGYIAWEGKDGHDSEIFLYDGIATIQITDNNYQDYEPQIHDGLVTWWGWDGHDYEIFLYDFRTGISTQITDNEYDDRLPQIHEGQITWVRWDGNDNEIFLATPSEDKTPPFITIEYLDGDHTDGNPGKWNVLAYDEESGINEDTIKILIDGEFVGNLFGDYDVPNALGEHTIYVEVENNDGYLGSESDSVTIIDDDITPPEIIIDYIGDGLDNNPGYFEWNIFDIDSGINDINITVTFESTEGLDDYTIYPEGTAIGSWDLPPNLGIYTIEIFARDNDDDRTLIVDSLTIKLTRDQEIVDDDINPPELSNLIIIPDIFEINITFGATDESGIGDISTFINGEIVEPLTQIQYGNTYSLTFENQWLFEIGTSEVLIQVEDGDDDRPNDTLTSQITGTFENILYQMYEYVDWQLEELKNYIDENLYPCTARFLNRKLTIVQVHLNEAFSYIENGNITCGLFHDAIAKVMVQITEFKVELLNRFDRIDDEQAEYIIDSIHTIRNNIVLLMGGSTGTEQGYNIASIEIDLLNLMDFIEDEIDWRGRWCLNYLFRSATRMLEIAIFKISMNLDINCTLTCVLWKLERAVCKVNRLLDRGKITQELADIILDKINQAYIDIEVVKTSI